MLKITSLLDSLIRVIDQTLHSLQVYIVWIYGTLLTTGHSSCKPVTGGDCSSLWTWWPPPCDINQTQSFICHSWRRPVTTALQLRCARLLSVIFECLLGGGQPEVWTADAACCHDSSSVFLRLCAFRTAPHVTLSAFFPCCDMGRTYLRVWAFTPEMRRKGRALLIVAQQQEVAFI